MRRTIVGCIVTLALSFVVVPLADAQPVGKVPRIGVLGPRPPAAFVFQIERPSGKGCASWATSRDNTW